MKTEPLHPESMRQLRALAKLHGIAELQAALRQIEQGVIQVKKITLSRKLPEGIASYTTRALDNADERELALQEDCIHAIKAGLDQCNDKVQAKAIAKLILSASAAVHSDLERILRQHGKKQNEPAS